ncbi:type 2 isopentenyl-diphosphate Delta-isomerase [Legionella geestiana]|uniref:type 2 isopentenyl-diphosphate Delta-isomerase n=1 Tax=Legionella geestiana TaxID=45065 RepID=UPI001092E8E4|nr:type 2 isopentenyl-diphosphate Delta-isomerase [Legionella geestiana]QDQ40273.1 type 2 isopentenyl-diphosphate Delta-isomerase [Legionella geestiana]
MQDTLQQFEQRKRDHIALALMPENEAREWNALDAVRLRHEALPELDFDELVLATTRFGQTVSTPLLVSSMTAGHRDAARVNRHLMEACSIRGWAMGVGSQRRELTDTAAAAEWASLVRDFPNVARFGNLGIAQLIVTPIVEVERLVDNLEASAFIIHCNPLQECIQPEGTPSFRGALEAIKRLAHALPVPVIVKETGCGFSTDTLKRLADTAIAAVDVSGLGGTHWGRIESHRTGDDAQRTAAGAAFRDWGIDTVSSLRAAVESGVPYEVWGSGGVRHGLDVARLLALGASTVGLAKPMLGPALSSVEAVCECMEATEYALKVAMFCTGSATISMLRGKYAIER